jgi:peptide/nickel transport system substrate-binding protein
VIRHVIWQALLALLGIALVFIVLFQLASRFTPPVETVAVPVAGGTYIEGMLGLSESINPILAPNVVQANPVDQDLSALVFDGLTRLDEAGRLLPALATDWQVSEDGTAYEFQLRQGVTWHDGAPFTAADVVFTVQAMQDPGYRGPETLGELWRSVTVQQLDDYTVRFTLDEPFPSFLYYTTIGLLPAHLLGTVPASDLPEHAFSTKSPVGTGMFQVESMSPDRVVLVPYPEYWGGTPYLERVEFWLFGSEEDLLAAYRRGEIQGFPVERPQSLSTLSHEANLQFYSALNAGYGVVYLNLKRETTPFFQVKEVRQALLYGLDRQALIDGALAGQGLVADSPILPVLWAYDPTVRHYSYDPERAIGLLDASGWQDSDADRIRDKDGNSLAFTLLTSDDPAMAQMAQQMANQWTAIGVDVSVRSVSSGGVATLVRNRDFDAALTEIRLVADPDPYPLWHSTQAEEPGQNFSGFANEDADLLMEEGRATTDPDRLAELYASFQQIFGEEVPALLLYYPIYTYAVDAQVHNVQLAPLLHTSDRFRNIADWYVETETVKASGEEPLDKSGE